MNASPEQYRAALANADDLIVVSEGFRDLSRVGLAPVRVINHRLLTRLGFSSAEIRGYEGRPLRDLLLDLVGDPQALAGLWEGLGATGSASEGLFRFEKAGRGMWVRTRSQVLPCPEEGHYFLGNFHDCTAGQETADRLRAERGDRADWDTFLRHELRGKLGPIIGFSELLLINYAQFDEKRIREFLTSILESAHRLNGILDISREVQGYEQGEVALESASQDVLDAVRGGVQEATLVIRRDIPDHPAECRIEASDGGPVRPVVIRHDSLKLQRALRCLLVNAWEHAREPAVVRVGEAQNGATLEVWNAGPPIPEVRLARVFDRFNSTKSGRMGLGTTLARLLVESHGGRITAASSEAEGTAFTIWLPAES